jgi:hypothetical protein
MEAVSGSFFTRIGIGGIPFLFPLLYQVGLGFTPIQSGLLLMPQAIAAMSLKLTMPRIVARISFRGVLISNTVISVYSSCSSRPSACELRSGSSWPKCSALDSSLRCNVRV